MKDAIARGFTIIEIMIATSVFSIVLLVALAGFSGVGDIFYKGVAINQTQSIASQIMNDLRSNIQNAPAISGPLTSTTGYSYYCIGNTRYTYQLNTVYDASIKEGQDQNGNVTWAPGSNYGLVKDILPGSGACAAPCTTSCGLGEAAFNNPQEILANKMQIIRFDITPDANSSELYNVYVNVAYGDPSDFVNPGDPDTMACQGDISQQKFCAVSRYNSSVYQGLHS